MSANSGRDRRADPLGLRLDLEPRVLLGLTSGGHDHLRKTVHAPCLLVVDPRTRVELLQLARERDRILARVPLHDRSGTGLSGNQALP
jgi:hypothetical protein